VPPYVGSTYGFVAIADGFLFGGPDKAYHAFKSDYSVNWTTAPFSGTGVSLNNPMLVAKGLALGTSFNAGQIFAYTKCAPNAAGCTGGQLKWTYAGSGDLGSISPIATGPDGTLYFTDDANKEFVALTPGTSSASPSPAWNVTGPPAQLRQCRLQLLN
jgi:outer membrane protein assembly factor BamB